MKPKRLLASLLLPALLLAAVFLAGCKSHPAAAKRHTTILGGLIETREASYRQLPPNTIGLKVSEVNPGTDFTGNELSLFWGLITIIDQ
ncbi:MAG: hypothetical protein EA425_06770 [Puniceicoccaceae bacterium]|nr:MAG: hypothetical protein EA425_06770 [Puniceicoccaceae bacterium]